MKALDQGLRDAVLRAHKRGTAPSKLAEKYSLSIGTVKSWIQRSKVASKKAHRDAKRKQPDGQTGKQKQGRPGAPLGNKNAVGGLGGAAPLGNKNAVSTHEYESILLDVLPDEDREAWHRISTDKLIQLDTEIRVAEIRERRMLQRIENLREALHTMVQYEEEQTSLMGAGDDGGTTELPATVTKRKYEGTLGQIQRIEDALTRVQAHKARLLKIRNDFEELDLRREEMGLKNW